MSNSSEKSRTESRSREQPASAPSEPETINRQGAVDEGDIAQRAYRRFEERGYEHGHDMEDWLEAEREMRQPASRIGGGSE